MSKIAEQKALEVYPTPLDDSPFVSKGFIDEKRREGYIVGYDQAMQDMARDADRLQYLSDELGYAYACGCKKTMQDFMEKAEEFFYEQFNIHSHDCHVVQYVSDTPLEDIDGFVEQFKNYMQNEN